MPTSTAKLLPLRGSVRFGAGVSTGTRVSWAKAVRGTAGAGSFAGLLSVFLFRSGDLFSGPGSPVRSRGGALLTDITTAGGIELFFFVGV